MSTEAPAVENTGATENDAPEVSYESRRAEAFKERFGEEPRPAEEAPVHEEAPVEEQAAPKPTTPQARKPYQHAVPPDRVEAMLRQRDQRIIELETENRLAREGRLTPAQQAAQQQQESQAPVNARPNPADFKNADGSFNEDAYVDALTDHATNKALAKLNETLEERQARANAEAQHEEVMRTSVELSTSFHTQAREILDSADMQPEVKEDMKAAIEFITSDAVASHIPLPIQHEIMRAGPGVAYLLAQDQRLVNVLVSGDTVTAARLIATAEQYLASRTQGQPAPTPHRQPAPAAPRQTNGQYAPRQQPQGPVDIEGVPSVNTGNDYESHRERRMRAQGWA